MVEVAWVGWPEAVVGCLAVLVECQAVMVCLIVVLGAVVEFPQTEAVMVCLVVVVESLEDWDEAGVVCLVVVVVNLWVMVGARVDWAGAVLF